MPETDEDEDEQKIEEDNQAEINRTVNAQECGQWGCDDEDCKNTSDQGARDVFAPGNGYSAAG